MYTINAAEMQAILTQCPHLEAISITGSVNNSTLSLLARSSVKQVRFGDDIHINHKLCELFTNLLSLRIHIHDAADAHFLITLAKNSPSLQRLTVHSMKTILNSLHLVVVNLPALRVLVVTTSDGKCEAALRPLICGFLKGMCPQLLRIALPFK